MKYTLVMMILVIASQIGFTQSAVYYSFDNCSLKEESGGVPARSDAPPACVCAMENDGLYFDGNISNLEIPIDLDSMFSGDFTIDFYFRIERSAATTDILSIRNSCALDSLISIKYNPDEKAINVEMARNVENYKLFEIKIDENKCWNRLSLTKTGLLYRIYLNNVLSGEYSPPANIIFGSKARMSFSNSPCLQTTDKRFRGWIDELRVLPQSLSRTQLINDYLYPDEIVSKDTTIIQGEMIDISLGSTCSDKISWTPSSSIIMNQDSSIRVRPDTSTTYTSRIIHTPRCITTDNIRVYVVSKEQKDCGKLLLPDAFTPNGDRLNDTYGIDNIFLVDELKSFEIYNRQGALLWKGNKKTDRWDGTYNGTHINGEMCLYRITYVCDGSEYVKVDNFALLR